MSGLYKRKSIKALCCQKNYNKEIKTLFFPIGNKKNGKELINFLNNSKFDFITLYPQSTFTFDFIDDDHKITREIINYRLLGHNSEYKDCFGKSLCTGTIVTYYSRDDWYFWKNKQIDNYDSIENCLFTYDIKKKCYVIKNDKIVLFSLDPNPDKKDTILDKIEICRLSYLKENEQSFIEEFNDKIYIKYINRFIKENSIDISDLIDN